MNTPLLDIDAVARIGLMFLDGDRLKTLLTDPYNTDEDDTDFDYESFNALKKTILKIERIVPEYGLSVILWMPYPGNAELVIPAMAGMSLPKEGWNVTQGPAPLMETLLTGSATSLERGEGGVSRYFAIRDSTHVIVGAMEFLIRAYR